MLCAGNAKGASSCKSQPSMRSLLPTQISHELVVLEKINQTPEFSPGALLEAVTRPALEFW